MTFGDIMQALYDRLGVTGETAMIERLVNNAKDRVIHGAKWPWLETQSTVQAIPAVRNYVLGSDVAGIIAIYGADGVPLEPVERVTYDRLYRGDVTTAVAPVLYTREQFATTGAPGIHIWSEPTTTTTLTVEHVVRVPDGSNAASTVSFEQVPTDMGIIIQQAAEAAFHEWESSPQAEALEAKYNRSLAEAAAFYQAPVIDDGTR